MKIAKVIYDEQSIKVTIPEPTLLYNAAGVPHNRMTVYIDWSPDIEYPDNFKDQMRAGDVLNDKWADKLKQMIIGATVQAIVKKFDEGIVKND